MTPTDELISKLVELHVRDAATTSEAIARLDAALARYGLKRGDVHPEIAERLRQRDS